LCECTGVKETAGLFIYSSRSHNTHGRRLFKRFSCFQRFFSIKPFKFNFKREVDRYIFDYFPLLMCVLYNIIFSQYSPLSATEMATVMAAAKKNMASFSYFVSVWRSAALVCVWVNLSSRLATIFVNNFCALFPLEIGAHAQSADAVFFLHLFSALQTSLLDCS